MPNQYTEKIDPLVRFWQKVEIQDNGCWDWTGNINWKGYGGFRFNGRSGKAHRFAYEFFVGPIPEDLQIDHLCKNRRCVNPAHMELVTTQENTRRGNNLLKNHCHRGHPFDLANTYYRPDGSRYCRACARVRDKYYRARKRAKLVLEGGNYDNKTKG